jgi:hypothetical protein
MGLHGLRRAPNEHIICSLAKDYGRGRYEELSNMRPEMMSLIKALSAQIGLRSYFVPYTPSSSNTSFSPFAIKAMPPSRNIHRSTASALSQPVCPNFVSW